MAELRKVRAVLRLAVVSAVFWGSAALLGRIGYDIVEGHPPFVFALVPWYLTRFFLVGATLGFVGGAIYAGAIALAPNADNLSAFTAKRAAFLGALGGGIVFLVVRVTLLTGVTAGFVPTVLVPTLVFGALGAATGLGILGTAKRGELKSGGASPKSIAP